jgi:hypothetical protein
MREYKVKWEIDIEANTPEEAARAAQQKQQLARIGYWVGGFDVTDRSSGESHAFDLDELDGNDVSGEASPQEIARVRTLVLDLIKTSLSNGVLDQGTLTRFLGEECGLAASDAEIAATKEVHRIDDECELDDFPLRSPGERGVFINAWLWVPQKAIDAEEKKAAAAPGAETPRPA